MKAVWIAVGLLLVPGAMSAGDDADLLPPSGFLQVWTRAEKTQVFNGAELYGHIDGGAELFLEFGFGGLTLQRYRNGGDALVLEVYRMADPEAALGIYLMKCGRETPDPGFRDRHTVGRYQLALAKHRYYVVVTRETGRTDLAPALVHFGRYVASRLTAEPPPKVLGLLPKEGLIESSIRLIRGPYSLQSVADLGEGDVLLLGGKIVAVSGDYPQAGGKRQTLLAVDYPGVESANAAFRSLKARLDPACKVLEAGDARLAFTDPGGKPGLCLVRGSRIEIRLGP